jgi:hypothetical protein
MQQLLDVASPVRGKTLVPDGRYEALMALKALGEFTRPDALTLLRGSEDWQRRPARFIDEQTAEQWVRAGETATFLRWVLGVEPLSHSTLRARLSEIGVEARRFEDWRAPHPKMVLCQLTDELVEYVENRAPGTSETASESGDRAERMPF